MMTKPDPTAYMGNYNFPQMLFAFVLDSSPCLFAVNEINEFKGCPLPEFLGNLNEYSSASSMSIAHRYYFYCHETGGILIRNLL